MRNLSGFGALAVGVLVLSLHLPELLGRVPRSGDLLLDGLPKARLLHEAVARGTLPFWTDRMFLGYPLCASGEAGALDPVTWGVHRLAGLGPEAAALFDLVLRHAAFALLVYALATRALRTTVARVGVGVAMALSGFTLGHAVHGEVMRALPYIPLLCLLSGFRGPRGVGVTGVAAGGLWLAGDPAMALVGTAGWWLWVLSDELGDGRTGPALARTTSRCGPALALGLGIAACQLVPMAELAGLSRCSPPAWSRVAVDGWLSWVLPFHKGVPGEGGGGTGFIGVVPLLMALSGWSLVSGPVRRFAVLVAGAALVAGVLGGGLAARGVVLVELALALAYGQVLDALARDGLLATRAALGERWIRLARQVLVAALAVGLAGGMAARFEPQAAGAALRNAAPGALFGAAVVGMAARWVLRLPGPIAGRWLLALALVDSGGRFAPHVRGTLPRDPGVARGASAVELSRVASDARVYVRPGGLRVSVEGVARAGVGNACLGAGVGSVTGVARFPLESWFGYFGHAGDRAVAGVDELGAVWARMSPADAARFDLANVTHMFAVSRFSDLEAVSFGLEGWAHRRAGALGWAYLAYPVREPVACAPSLVIERVGEPRVTACAIRVPNGPVVERHVDGEIDISLNNVRSSWLVAAVANYPGWEAFVDGTPAPLANAAGALIALPLSSGSHRVLLRYVPRAFQRGLGISLASLAVALGLAALRARK